MTAPVPPFPEGKPSPPRATPGMKPVLLDLTGYTIPCHGNQPVLVGMPGTDDLFLPVFESLELLEEWSRHFKIRYERVKAITDGDEFVDSLPKEIRVAVNLRPHDDPEKRRRGGVRFVEVQR